MTGFEAVLPVISAVGTVLSMTQGPKEAKAPKEIAPTVMPTEDSALVAEAKRRTLVAQAARGGRASTVLTDTEETFGGN